VYVTGRKASTELVSDGAAALWLQLRRYELKPITRQTTIYLHSL